MSAASETREQWSGQLGFIFAAVGSAIGLGNIWRFPGVAYENGGGAFLIPYIVALLTAGIPVLLLDYSIGHRFRGSAPTSFRRLTRRAEGLGWFQVGVSWVIILYYTVVIAWSASYMVFAATQAWGEDPAGFFIGEYLQAGDTEALSTTIVGSVLVPLVIIWVIAVGILSLGVQRGVERANVVFIPLLVAMFLVIVVRAVTLPGAVDGLNAFFTPDWPALADPQVWIAAYGQIFFSLSIAFGIMLTFSSYLRRRANLTSTGLVVGFANSSFELLAGIGVFSALGFMAAQQGVAVADLDTIQGIGLAFIAFPQILSLMPGGPVFGVLFFASLTLAGLTSLLSILQVVSAAFQEKFGWTGRQAALRIGSVAAVVSIALFSTASGLFVLDTVDKFINDLGVVGSAVLTTVLVGLALRRLREMQAHLNGRPGLSLGTWWRFLVGVVVPLVLGYILVRGAMSLVAAPYSEYPGWLLGWFGWGTLALVLGIAVVLTLMPWHRSVDDFVAEPLPELAKEAVR